MFFNDFLQKVNGFLETSGYIAESVEKVFHLAEEVIEKLGFLTYCICCFECKFLRFRAVFPSQTKF